MTLPFTGIATFAKVPRYDPAEAPTPHVAILGIPTDEGATQHPGARYGPRAIREASTQFPYYKRGRGYYDPERDRPMLAELELRDAGDVEVVPTLFEENAKRIAEAVAGLLSRGVFPVCLGGDHSVTAAILPAFSDTPIHLVQIDAHMDFVDRLAGQSHRHHGGRPGAAGARLVGRSHGGRLSHPGHRCLRPGRRPRHRLCGAGGPPVPRRGPVAHDAGEAPSPPGDGPGRGEPLPGCLPAHGTPRRADDPGGPELRLRSPHPSPLIRDQRPCRPGSSWRRREPETDRWPGLHERRESVGRMHHQ
ncbi:MAG: arginase family protein [candidate division NC10 bacterium]|nr:arginase family protein [candidate division NC10 bacterium]